MALNKSRQIEYLVAGFGSLIGAVLLGVLGTYLGMMYGKIFMPKAGLEGLLPILLGVFLGWWIGEVMGCWSALRWRGYVYSKRTAILLAIITPFGIILWMIIHPMLFNLFRGNMSDLEFTAIDNKMRMITASFTSIGLGSLARFLSTIKPKNADENY